MASDAFGLFMAISLCKHRSGYRRFTSLFLLREPPAFRHLRELHMCRKPPSAGTLSISRLSEASTSSSSQSCGQWGSSTSGRKASGLRLINTERESELGQAENDAANDGDLIAINALTGPAPPTCLQALVEYHSLNYSDPIKCADTPLMT